MTTRDDIERALSAMNNAENANDLTAEQKSRVVDDLCTADVQGWANGAARGGRAEEREQEAFLWSAITDYHREFDRLVIDAPLAAVSWRLSGSLGDEVVMLTGSTIFEFDDSAKISRFWMHFNDPLG